MVDFNVLFGSFEERRMEDFRGKKYIEKWEKSNLLENHKLMFMISIFLI